MLQSANATLAICAIVSITVTAATLALWLKHRMKHISSRGPYLSSRKAANCVTLESLQILQLPPSLKWRSNIYPCLLSGSVQLFWSRSILLFFISVLISSLWRGQWWDIFRLCCCLFSAIVYSLNLNIWYAREWLTLLRYSPVDFCKSN